MNTTFEGTSVTPHATDHELREILLEHVKEKLLDESRDAGDRESTVKNKDVQWGLHLRILAEMGVTTTVEVNRTLVKEALHAYRERPHRIAGKNKKKSSVLTHAVQVSCFWREAYEQRYMSSHLLAGAKLPKADAACIVVPRDEDAPTIERAIRGYHDLNANPSMRFSRTTHYVERHCHRSMVIYCLAISSALRRFEIHNVKVEDIDFAAMTIQLPMTKSREVRVVPMSSRTAAEISALIKILPLEARTGYLIRGEMLEPMSPAAISRQIERIIAWGRAQGLPLREFTLHGLRHKAISDMLQINPEHARLMAGHKDIKTTIRVYGHTAIKDVQASHDKADIFTRLAAQKPVQKVQKPSRQHRLF